MKTEIGEYIVGAYLKLIKQCSVVDYNVRRPGGGLAGLEEIDVIGLDFKNETAYLCEVTTHLDGLLYGSSNADTIKRIQRKYLNMQNYAKDYLTDFLNYHKFMFWSPVVTPATRIALEEMEGLELIINDIYADSVEQLREFAKKHTYDTGNPAMRVLQILGHLRKEKSIRK